MLVVAGLFLALEIYIAYLRFTIWLFHKWVLFRLGVKLIKSKNKLIKEIGWATIRMMFWESDDEEKK